MLSILKKLLRNRDSYAKFHSARREKADHLEENELRVIKIPREAITEMIWETFMEIGDEKLDLVPNNDDIVFHMTMDEMMTELVFYAFDNSDNQVPDFKKMDEFIRKNVGITSKSLYEPYRKHYETVFLPKE